jgi:hypothetical protein
MFRPDILGGSLLGGLLFIVDAPAPPTNGSGGGGRPKKPKRRDEVDAEVMQMLQFALQHIDP